MKEGEIYKKVLENIKSLLAEKKIKQCELANHLGLTKQQMSDIFNGRKKLTIEYLPRIAEQLNVEIGELFDGITA